LTAGRRPDGRQPRSRSAGRPRYPVLSRIGWCVDSPCRRAGLAAAITPAPANPKEPAGRSGPKAGLCGSMSVSNIVSSFSTSPTSAKGAAARGGCQPNSGDSCIISAF